MRPFLPTPLEPFPDSLQISVREFIRTKARGKGFDGVNDPLAKLQPKIKDLEII